LQHAGQPASIEFLKDTVFEKKDDIDRITAWKLILAIIGFLGLMGVGFYLRWFLLLKSRRGPKASEVLDQAPLISEHVEGHIGLKQDEPEQIDIADDKDKRKAG